MKKAILYSILTHAIVFIGIIIFARIASSPEIKNSKLKGSSLLDVTLYRGDSQINSKNERLSRNKNSGTSNSADSHPENKSSHGPTLKDLRIGQSLGRSSGDSSSPSSGTQGGSDGFDLANTMGVEQESGLYPFFEAIWQKINASTGYPADFVQERMTGTVTVQLHVNRKGVFTGTFGKITSDSPLLKAYVMAVLVHALELPLPENRWADREEMILVTDFDFRIFGYGGVPRISERKHLKNLLYFERDAYGDPKLNQAIDKILTKFIPPVIILPGFFYVDFYRIYKMVEAMGEPDPDEMRRTRIQISKEEWQRAIHKGPEL